MEPSAKQRRAWTWSFGKVSQAITRLIIGEGDARERVLWAFDYLAAVHPNMVPPRCREDVKWIQRMCTRFPANGRFSAEEMTRKRSRNSTASMIAARVWKLYSDLESELSRSPIAAAREGPGSPTR